MFICPLRGKRRRPQLVMQSDGASVVGPWEASWAAAGVPDNEEGKQEVLRKGTDMAGDEHDFEGRSRAAQAKAAHALDHLLKLAETRDSGQIRRVARFIAALYNGDAYPLDLFELRAVDVAISDDVINCIDALRWVSVQRPHLALRPRVPDDGVHLKIGGHLCIPILPHAEFMRRSSRPLCWPRAMSPERRLRRWRWRTG